MNTNTFRGRANSKLKAEYVGTLPNQSDRGPITVYRSDGVLRACLTTEWNDQWEREPRTERFEFRLPEPRDLVAGQSETLFPPRSTSHKQWVQVGDVKIRAGCTVRFVPHGTGYRVLAMDGEYLWVMKDGGKKPATVLRADVQPDIPGQIFEFREPRYYEWFQSSIAGESGLIHNKDSNFNGKRWVAKA